MPCASLVALGAEAGEWDLATVSASVRREWDRDIAGVLKSLAFDPRLAGPSFKFHLQTSREARNIDPEVGEAMDRAEAAAVDLEDEQGQKEDAEAAAGKAAKQAKARAKAKAAAKARGRPTGKSKFAAKRKAQAPPPQSPSKRICLESLAGDKYDEEGPDRTVRAKLLPAKPSTKNKKQPKWHAVCRDVVSEMHAERAQVVTLKAVREETFRRAHLPSTPQLKGDFKHFMEKAFILH